MKNESEVLLGSVRYMAERGFHARTIARVTGLSVGQVSYRIHALGLALRAYREGDTAVAKGYIKVAPNIVQEIRATPGKPYVVKPLLTEN